eukprot:6185320-Pleurochrysis_carterae.AAC.1
MSLAEAAAFARANAGNRRSAPSARETRAPKDDADASKPKPKSLVEISAELRDKKKKESNAKSEWEATHPWRPWNRDTDLDVRLTKPKDKETILNNQHLGTLGNRFAASEGGTGERRECAGCGGEWGEHSSKDNGMRAFEEMRTVCRRTRRWAMFVRVPRSRGTRDGSRYRT